MAEQAILEVSLKDYKKQIDDLRGSLLNLESTSKEYQDAAEQIRTMQEKLNEVMGIGKEKADGVDGSYNQLSQTLSKLKKEWKTLEIGSERWTQLGQEIDSINEKLKDADASVGVFGRNVGNYQKSFEDAFKSMLPELGNISPELGKVGGMLGRMIPVIKSVNSVAVQGLKGIKAAIVSTGIGALVIAFGALTQVITKNWDKIKDWALGLTNARKQLEAYKKQVEATAEAHKRYIDFIKSDGATSYAVYTAEIDYAIKAERSAFAEYLKIVDQFGRRSKEADEARKKWEEAYNAVGKAVLDGKDAVQLFINEMERAKNQEGMTQLKKDLDNSNQKFEDMIALVNKLGKEGKYTADEVERITGALKNYKKEEEGRIRSAAGKSAWQKETEEIKRLLKELRDYRKTDVELLDQQYQEQLKLFQKHHKDTTALTERYVNERARLIRESEQENRKAYYETIKQLNSSYTLDVLNAELNDAQKNFENFTKIIGDKWPPKPPIDNAIAELNDEMVESAYNVGLIATKTKEELAAAWVLAAQKQREAEKAVKSYNAAVNKAQKDIQQQELRNEYNLSLLVEGTDAYFKTSIDGTRQLIKRQEEYVAALESIKEPTEEQTEELQRAKIQLNEQNKALREQLNLQKQIGLERAIQAADNKATGANTNSNTSGLWNNTNFDEGYQARIAAAQIYYDAVKKMQYQNDEARIAAELEAQQKLYDIQREYNEAKIANYMNLASSLGTIFSAIGDLYAQDIANQVQNNKMSQAEAEKQYKKVQALKISEAIIQTIQGALAAFMGYQSLGQPWGGILGGIAAAAVTATGAAQIAQIKAQNPYSSSSPVASSYQASMPIMQEYSPEAFTNLTGAQDTQSLANALAENPIRAYVTESDVTAKQEIRKQREEESTF